MGRWAGRVGEGAGRDRREGIGSQGMRASSQDRQLRRGRYPGRQAGRQAGQAPTQGRQTNGQGRQTTGRTHAHTHARTHARTWRETAPAPFMAVLVTNSQFSNSACVSVGGWVGGKRQQASESEHVQIGSATSNTLAGVLAGSVFGGCGLESGGHTLPAQRPNSSAHCHRQLSSPSPAACPG